MELTERFETALVYATKLHATQTRKGSGIPYVSHLLGVCSLVLEYGGDEDQAIAALLHDGPEDQGGAETLRDIEARFGARVARIVDGCTDGLPDDAGLREHWFARKQRYVQHLESADADIVLVSCSDKLYNARSVVGDQLHLGDATFERFAAQKRGTLAYYGSIVETMRRHCAAGRLPTALFTALERTVEKLEELAGAAKRTTLADYDC
ncbi:MAG: HD domain-containing protein [Planctomycetota bacterium]